MDFHRKPMNTPASDEVSLLREELCLTTKYVRPEGSDAEALAGIWRDVLDIDQVGINDDFFEIGGDSLAATIIASNIESRFGCRFSPSQLIEHSTISSQIAIVSKQQKAQSVAASNFTVLREEGELAPLFVIHGNRGFTLYDQRFLRGMDDNRPIIFIEAIGMDGKEEMPNSVAEMAQRYYSSVCQMIGDRPWHLVANCGGSLIAIEMCRLAEQSGRLPESLMLIDPVSRLFLNSEPNGLKRWSRSIGNILLPVAIRRYIKQLRSKIGAGSSDDFADELNKSARMQALVEGRIKERHSSFPEPLISSKISYQADAMHQVLSRMRKLVYEHVPKRWEGLAHVIVSKPRASSIRAIRQVLPNAEFKIAKCSHKDLFQDNLTELLSFLNDVITSQEDAAGSQ